MNSTMEQDLEVNDSQLETAERSDEDLLLDYRDHGDRDAFEQLVRRYERELYNYLRQYLGNAQMAEDVFQATFLQVHLKCEQYEPGRKVRPWLYTVATNQAIDAQRKNKRHRMVSLDRCYGGEQQDEIGALVDLLAGGEDDPLDRLDTAETDAMVRHCIGQLPESLQQVITLVYYQGMKYREAAEVLATPVGTVKSRLHAAVQKLHAALAETPLAQYD